MIINNNLKNFCRIEYQCIGFSIYLDIRKVLSFRNILGVIGSDDNGSISVLWLVLSKWMNTAKQTCRINISKPVVNIFLRKLYIYKKLNLKIGKFCNYCNSFPICNNGDF